MVCLGNICINTVQKGAKDDDDDDDDDNNNNNRVTTAWRILRLLMEERPPVWKVAVNILNKQSRTAQKGWSSSLGVA
jgi:hypothetical protein